MDQKNSEVSARSRRSKGFADRGTGLILLTLAAAWAAYAAPAAIATLVALPGDGAAQLVYAGESPTEEGWLRLLDSREAALRFADRASLRRDLGVAFFVLAETFADDATMREDLLRRAVLELETALVRSPVDPPVLALLAHAHLELAEPEPAKKWLNAARSLAPFSPETALSRLTSDVRAGHKLSEHAQLRDVRTAFARDREGLARFLVNFQAGDQVLALIADEDFRYELSVALMRAREALEAEP